MKESTVNSSATNQKRYGTWKSGFAPCATISINANARPELMTGSKPTHGGKRTGAGRKPSGEAKRNLTIRLTPAKLDKLATIRATTGESTSAIVERAIENLDR